ncbi:MAG: Gfo/Idh/MocA family oxidoreductase [Spirochaetales bacterium]|nr:Gfo/Idh/MocA family oxidoreductase [Spirochaetales bacterium]
MSKTYGWGIIGTGGIAALQTRDLITSGLSVAAVGSRTPAAADEFADRFEIPRRHGSYEALVADPGVDIVYVATPHPMHAGNALLAIEAGKHVLVEKPFTLSAVQARQIAEAAHGHGVFVMEAMWTRFVPSMVRVMERIRGGAIGTPRILLADHNQYIPRASAVRLHEPALGGGALLDLGVYPLSFAAHIFGSPTTVTARGTLTDLGVDELTSVILEYESGAHASLNTGFLTPGPNVASVVGTEGRIDIDAVWYTHTSFTRYDRSGAVAERYRERIEGRGMQYQAHEVERCIREGLPESPTMPLSESIEIAETMDEIRRQIGVEYPQEAV